MKKLIVTFRNFRIRLTKESLNGLLTSCAITAFYNTLLKERYGGREDEAEEVSSY